MSFYVAAVVKPLCPSFFVPLFFSLHCGVQGDHDTAQICISAQMRRHCNGRRYLQGQRRSWPSSWAVHLMLPVTRPRLGWRLPWPLRPIVSNDLLSVRAPAPVPRCSRRLSTESAGPAEATPSLRRRAGQARKCIGSPPPAPRPRCDFASQMRLPLFEPCSLGEPPGLEASPQGHE